MEKELKKYRVVTESYTTDASFFEEKINALADVGYRVSQLATVRPIEGWTDGEYVAIMSLKSSADLSKGMDFENADIGSQKQRELLNRGYVALANYSKHVTYIKIKENEE